MNLTRQYQFNTLGIGDSLVVYQRFQHARVAASEYARRHNVVFSCRVEYDDAGNKSMRIHRVAQDQARVDNRGRNGRRRIASNNEPTALQFDAWLSGFSVGQSYIMPASYSHMYAAMQAWCELHSIKHHRSIVTIVSNGELHIERSA